jgi:hypothetical protein
MCALAFCTADETGCADEKKCDKPGYGISTHGQFVAKHGRCPAFCTNPEFPPAGVDHAPRTEELDPNSDEARQLKMPFMES